MFFQSKNGSRWIKWSENACLYEYSLKHVFTIVCHMLCREKDVDDLQKASIKQMFSDQAAFDNQLTREQVYMLP